MEGFQPPAKLRDAILSSIRKSERHRARVCLVASGTTFLASLVGLFFSIQFLLQTFYNSEFYSYVTLIFSDPDAVVGFWQDIALSLADSLPVIAIVVLLVVTFAFLASMRVMVKNIRAALAPSFSA